MTPLAGLSQQPSHKLQLGWLAAIGGAALLHAAVAFYFWWQPESQLSLAPAAAPQVFEISMVAAPVAPATELPIDRQQQQSSPPPQMRSQTKVQKTQEKLVLAEATKSEFVLPQQQDLEEQEALKPPEENPEENQQPAQQQNSAGDASGEQFVEESSAPLTMETREADVASAPQEGALNEHQAQAKLTWHSRLQAHLEQRKRYPRSARMRHQQGVPWVRFTINRTGKLLKVSLSRPSGHTALDREVVALVKRAEPLPPPPDNVTGDPITMEVPVEFFIR